MNWLRKQLLRSSTQLSLSWRLLAEAFRYLRSDSELLLVPVVSTLILMGLTAVLILTILATGMVTTTPVATTVTLQGVLIALGSYFTAAYVAMLSKAAVTYTVFVRVRGGNATLGQSFTAALKRSHQLFVLAVFNASIGFILRHIERHSETATSVISRVLGASWHFLSYFAVSIIMLEKKSTTKALKCSGQLVSSTWGATLLTNTSLMVIFTVLQLALFGLFVGSVAASVVFERPFYAVVGTLLFVIGVSLSYILYMVLTAIVRTLLYVYATSKVPPQEFDHELLAEVLGHKIVAGEQKL